MTPRVSYWSILFSALFLSSCITVDKTLGDTFIPTDQDLTVQMKVFDLPMSSKVCDSLPTNNFFYPAQGYSYLFGSCLDPLFGLTETGTVFQFLPASAGLIYGENPEPVSLTLYIECDQNPVVLDKSQSSIPQHLYVHEVLSERSFQTAYHNSLQPEDWNPRPLNHPGQLYFGTDTATISLSLDFARELLQATQTERDSSSAFQKRYKGLYLRTERATLPNGGRLNYGLDAHLVLKYTEAGGDSVLHYYTNYYGYNHNVISHSGASLDPHPAKNIYLQGLAGPKPYIDFVALVNNIKSWANQEQIDLKNLLIAQAEIVFSYAPSIHYEVVNQYPSKLFLCTRVSADSLAYYKPIEDSFSEYAGGNINRSKFWYTFNITRYLQTLLKSGQAQEKDNTWLLPIEATQNQMTGSWEYFIDNRSYPRATFEGTSTEFRPVVKITYAVLK